MKRILLSLGMIVFVAAAAAGATGAFFSDEETSTGNVLAAGAIDLGVDNSSYYNGVFSSSTSWAIDYDIDNTTASDTPRMFFSFNDLKPGDYGEDTISLHILNNDAWLCADVTITENNDNTCTEPENDPDAENGLCVEPNADLTDGDLVQQLDFVYWADDGDNVLETNEVASATTTTGLFGATVVGATTTLSLVDSTHNIFGGTGPLLATTTASYIGKAWCFGTLGLAADDQDGVGNVKTPAGNNDGNATAGQPTDGGYTCTGASGINNSSQTDVVRATVSFRAEQARHNADFLCAPQQAPAPIATLTLLKAVVGSSTPDTSWTLSATGPTPISGIEGAGAVTDAAVTPGAYTLTEAGPGGFTPSLSCTGGGSLVGNVLTLAANDVATCTFTNTSL